MAVGKQTLLCASQEASNIRCHLPQYWDYRVYSGQHGNGSHDGVSVLFSEQKHMKLEYQTIKNTNGGLWPLQEVRMERRHLVIARADWIIQN